MSQRLRILIVSLCIASIVTIGVSRTIEGFRQPPWDFTVNWVAAKAMQMRHSVYDVAALHVLAINLSGASASNLFQDTFTSYIGPPTTALLILPFTIFNFEQAVIAYRILLLVLFGLSVYIAGLTLPRAYHIFGGTVGALALILFQPVQVSIGLGQVDALVMLSLAVCVWASMKERWWLAGISIGLATLLKISPVLLLIYLLVKGKRQAVYAAAGTAGALLVLSAIVGSLSDLGIFLTQILPKLSGGTIHTQNQSLAAWLGRLLSPATNLLDYSSSLGALILIGLPLGIVVTLFFIRRFRAKPVNVLDFAFLILVALLAGPITWDHYTSWAIIPLVLCCDLQIWQNLPTRRWKLILAASTIGLVLFIAPTYYFDSVSIANDWFLRIATGSKTCGLLVWLAVVLYLRSQQPLQEKAISVPQLTQGDQLRLS